jgi:hypothetical protein
MAVINQLKDILRSSALEADEIHAFELGLSTLSEEEQKVFIEYISKYPDLIYPLYINFKVKLKAVKGTKKEWEEAVNTEITQLEEFLLKKRVGSEIRSNN